MLDGVTFPMKTQALSLGVLLDSALNLDAQVLAVARSTFAHLKLVHQQSLFVEMSNVAMVTHALFTSYLDYCNVLYMGLPSKSFQKLQLVQRAAARLLTGAGYGEHITPL